MGAKSLALLAINRGSIVALREVRGCLESLGDMLSRGDMLAKAAAANVEHKQLRIVFVDASLYPRCRCEWNERNERDHLQ